MLSDKAPIRLQHKIIRLSLHNLEHHVNLGVGFQFVKFSETSRETNIYLFLPPWLSYLGNMQVCTLIYGLTIYKIVVIMFSWEFKCCDVGQLIILLIESYIIFQVK